MRNTAIESNLDRKMYPRYTGPLIVVRRTKGGSYILAEMDGTVLKEKVGAFRVLPHVARYKRLDLPSNIHDLIDMSKEQLDALAEDMTDVDYEIGEDYAFEKDFTLDSSGLGKENFEDMQDDEVPELLSSEEEESPSGRRLRSTRKLHESEMRE